MDMAILVIRISLYPFNNVQVIAFDVWHPYYRSLLSHVFSGGSIILAFPPFLVTQQQLEQQLEYGTYHMPQMNE
jgi:hypothetical protein